MVKYSMKLDKSITVIRSMKDRDSDYVNASPEDRVSFVWEITREVWALKGGNDAERGLQRAVTNLIKKQR